MNPRETLLMFLLATAIAGLIGLQYGNQRSLEWAQTQNAESRKVIDGVFTRIYSIPQDVVISPEEMGKRRKR